MLADLEKELIERWRWEARAVFGQILRNGGNVDQVRDATMEIREYVARSFCRSLEEAILEEQSTVMLAKQAAQYPEGSPGRKCALAVIESFAALKPEGRWKNLGEKNSDDGR